MGGLSDQLLSGVCVEHIEALHGESVTVLSGPDAGKSFVAVQEIESDIVFDGELGPDPRGKRVLRFKIPNVPNLGSQDRIKTDDGKVWTASRRPGSAYLTTDFEISEVVNGKDT